MSLFACIIPLSRIKWMAVMDNRKIDRVLDLYTKLMDGAFVRKGQEAVNYGVDERTIQRDIDDIRYHLENSLVTTGVANSVIYDRDEKAYRLEKIYHVKLTNGEVLAICKILLDSRSLRQSDMSDVLRKLVACCVPEENQKIVKNLLANEAFHYVEPRHKRHLTETLWTLGEAIQNCKYVDIDYERSKDRSVVKRHIKPLSIMFSEYYFYLTAFIDDDDTRKDFDVVNDSFPTIYRVDRIRNLEMSSQGFHIPYSSRFEEGEFRKRVQFMYGGKLQKIKFSYSGPDVDAVLDRLPTAQIIAEDGGVYTITAEVFGKGIDMWLRSQGDFITVLEGRTQ